MNKKAKIALFSLPLFVGAYFIYKQFAKPSANGKTDAPPPPAPPNSVFNQPSSSATTSSAYPLGVGSKGDAVKSLQAILNAAGASPALSPDGIFGPKTLAALQAIVGKSSIQTPDEIGAISKKASLTNLKASNLDWAWQLLDSFNNNPDVSSLVIRIPMKLQGINKNFKGEWKPNGKILDIPTGGERLNLSDYQIKAAMNDGSLRIECTTGDNAGFWSTDANLDLKKYLDIE